MKNLALKRLETVNCQDPGISGKAKGPRHICMIENEPETWDLGLDEILSVTNR